MPDVVIYDPNHLNSYGSELSDIFLRNGRSVRHFVSEDRSFLLYSQDLAERSFLPGSFRRGSRVISHLARRIFDPLRAAFSARRDRPIIVVWTRDPWDTFCMLVRAQFGGLTYFVYHNPPSVRPRHGLQGILEVQLSKKARVIVHSDWLASQLPDSTPHPTVLPHPPYSAVARHAKSLPAASGNMDSLPKIGFIGSLRADKGLADLPIISMNSNTEWQLLIVGDSSGASEVKLTVPSGKERQVVSVVDGRPPTDDEMVKALHQCEVVIAPYRQVTESGSIHFAYAIGVQVLGYDSVGTRSLISDQSLVSGPEQLGGLIDEFLREPWRTFSHTFSTMESHVADSWLATLDRKQ